jgi:hypothetical protein
MILKRRKRSLEPRWIVCFSMGRRQSEQAFANRYRTREKAQRVAEYVNHNRYVSSGHPYAVRREDKPCEIWRFPYEQQPPKIWCPPCGEYVQQP